MLSIVFPLLAFDCLWKSCRKKCKKVHNTMMSYKREVRRAGKESKQDTCKCTKAPARCLCNNQDKVPRDPSYWGTLQSREWSTLICLPCAPSLCIRARQTALEPAAKRPYYLVFINLQGLRCKKYTHCLINVSQVCPACLPACLPAYRPVSLQNTSSTTVSNTPQFFKALKFKLPNNFHFSDFLSMLQHSPTQWYIFLPWQLRQ